MESSFLSPQRTLEAAHISEGSRVADLAAGAGFFTRAAARLAGPAGLVWAVDPNPDMLPRLKNLGAAEGLHNIEVVRGAADKRGGTKLPDAAMDAAILANALFSMEDKRAAAAEAYRVVRRAGRLILIDWTGSHGGLGRTRDMSLARRRPGRCSRRRVLHRRRKFPRERTIGALY